MVTITLSTIDELESTDNDGSKSTLTFPILGHTCLTQDKTKVKIKVVCISQIGDGNVAGHNNRCDFRHNEILSQIEFLRQENKILIEIIKALKE